MTTLPVTPGSAGSEGPIEALAKGLPSRLDPRVRTVWMLLRGGPWLVVAVIGVVMAIGADAPMVALWVLAAMIVPLVIGVWSAELSYRAWTFTTDDDALELSRGVISKHVSVIPYHRIQQIDIDRDPLQRLLGIATLVLRSAAATTDARIPGVALADTEALRQTLLARSGSDDAV